MNLISIDIRNADVRVRVAAVLNSIKEVAACFLPLHIFKLMKRLVR